MMKTLVLVLCLASLTGCASAPPAYSDVAKRAFNADRLFTDLQALSQTAVNLNAVKGKAHLSDRDTALIRDFTLAAGGGLHAYANGETTLSVVVFAYHQLMTKLSTEATVNDKLRVVLTLIDANISRIPQ